MMPDIQCAITTRLADFTEERLRKELRQVLEVVVTDLLDAITTKLTPREIDVLQQVHKGLGNREIAEALGVSLKTVEAHIQHIQQRTGGKTRHEAVKVALQRRWFTPDPST